eukprot:CAMPEP_0117688484 /NCGR_PEP_ID=MMETSP0804-20121206/23858_1 /TAXON_ID=1074897 /ORGANISM="Tetraselmis astigmatica, Strain CCMP880" /LENGTH=66 /DNA_ID=CAMNT_0005500947 /DNA_START=1 /DNA_END=201 /DNA_ORIENTATION=-
MPSNVAAAANLQDSGKLRAPQPRLPDHPATAVAATSKRPKLSISAARRVEAAALLDGGADSDDDFM